MLEYVTDFETNNSEKECRVWAWGVAAVSDTPETTFAYGSDIATWFDYLTKNQGRYWIHNLGFDGKFVIYWLITNGYEYVADKPKIGQFSALIDGMGRFYNIEIPLQGKSNKIVLADSYKKLPYKLAKVAEAYNLSNKKGVIDYDYVRPIDHIITADELDYLQQDCYILAKAMHQRLDMGSKLTTGADCLSNYKDLVGKEHFAKYFPRFNHVLDADIRRAYKGGFVWVNPKKQNRVIGEGISLDVNSLYPWAMRHNLMPYGMPVWEQGKPEPTDQYPLWVGEVTFTATLKDGSIPCIQPKNNIHYTGREYITQTVEPLTLMVCDVDWALINDMYDVCVYSWQYHYKFMGSMGLFDDYVDFGIEGKNSAATPGIRLNYKLWLNNLYGKYGQSIDCTGKVPVYDDETDTIKYVKGTPDERDPVYVPVALYVTAYARNKTIRSALLFGDRFCYTDTDSIHAEGTAIPDGIEVHPDKLGAWKLEAEFIKARYIRAKTYCEVLKNGKTDYICAGMMDGLKSVMQFDDFKAGFTTDITKDSEVDPRYLDKNLWKLTPKNVSGGVVLEPTPFTIHG